MRKNKKIFAGVFIGIGVLILPFSLIKGFPAAFIVSAGFALMAYGIADFLFEHFVHKIGRIKIMDEDERNVLINGKAYTLVSDFANMGFIVLALYSAVCKEDREIPSIRMILVVCCLLAYSTASFVNCAVVINRPFVAPCPANAPTNF